MLRKAHPKLKYAPDFAVYFTGGEAAAGTEGTAAGASHDHTGVPSAVGGRAHLAG